MHQIRHLAHISAFHVRRSSVGALTMVALLLALGTTVSLRAQDRSWSEPCEAETSTAATAAGRFTLPNRNPIQPYEILTLFRFHKQREALARLDAAQKLLAGPFRWRVPRDQQKDAISAVAALRRCIGAHQPPPLATLTVRTYGLGDRNRRVPLDGVRISVENLAVGTTRRGGALTLPVPSGAIHVTAWLGATNWGEGFVTLVPGSAGQLSIVLDPDKEGFDIHDVDLMLAEAVDDIVPVTSRTFTLKFVRNGHLVPVAEIRSLEVLDEDGNPERDLTQLFKVTDGVLRAGNPKAVFEAFAGEPERTIRLGVEAEDAKGLTAWNRVGFRIGQSRLSVMLVAPPSNPALPVANIEVGVSLLSDGVALPGVSDASGRFTLDSFPSGNVDLSCETTFQGDYYYGDATISLSGPLSVTLVLRNVKDIVNGVPPFKLSEK
jgi:hypothetical protein